MKLKRSRCDCHAIVRIQKERRQYRRILSLTAFAALVLAGCRLDMHVQPKYKPDRPTAFFHDGRSERPQVPHTIGHGEPPSDELLSTGRINGQVANVFPFVITAKDLERGQQRYNIYCSPCHDYNGTGHGMVVLRGFQQPPSYDIDRLRNAPVGHFFEVMTDGFGNMYSYASRVSPKDRWRIAAYIRALQLSRHATLSDVPTDEQTKLREQAQ